MAKTATPATAVLLNKLVRVFDSKNKLLREGKVSSEIVSKSTVVFTIGTQTFEVKRTADNIRLPRKVRGSGLNNTAMMVSNALPVEPAKKAPAKKAPAAKAGKDMAKLAAMKPAPKAKRAVKAKPVPSVGKVIETLAVALEGMSAIEMEFNRAAEKMREIEVMYEKELAEVRAKHDKEVKALEKALKQRTHQRDVAERALARAKAAATKARTTRQPLKRKPIKR